MSNMLPPHSPSFSSFVNSWQSMLRTHEVLGENRLRFAAKLGEMSEELSNLSKEVDKNRKQTRETGVRLEKNLQDAEAGVEKVSFMTFTKRL